MGESCNFGPFVLDPERQIVLRDGVTLPLGQRALALLTALAKADGPVDKSTLMEAAWLGTIVEENNLTVQISALRKALGLRDDGSEWIVTVPRVGYRLIKGATGSTNDAEIGGLKLPSIIVLPFQNLSGDVSQDYFADGVVEDLIMALSRFSTFVVLARSSSFAYKSRNVDVRELQRDLGVRYAVEGSMRRAGNRMRVTAQLVDAASGAQLWSDTFDGVVEDVFDVQERIAENVVGRIAPQIRAAEMERSRRARPENLDAYDLTLRAARYFYANPGYGADLETALELATLAVERDPTYAYGLHVAAWLDFNRILMGFSNLGENEQGACEALARRAIAAARGDPEILCRGALILIHISKDYDQNLALARSAVDDGPNNIDVLTEAAVVELHCGDVEEAIRLAKRAMALSPKDSVSGFPTATIAHANMILGDYEAAIERASRSVALNPAFFPAYWVLVAGNAQLGRMDAAKAWLTKWLEIQPHASLSQIRRVQPAKDPLRLAAIYEGLALAGVPDARSRSA